jgi:tetratricopeptide (TPR) repeat protein
MQCLFCGYAAPAAGGACPACGRALPPEPESNELVELSRPPSAVSADQMATIIDIPTGNTAPSFSRNTPLKPGQVINQRYRVIKLIGQGGMGAVYHAWDDELALAVALKVILPEGHDPATWDQLARRFKQELLLARQITHKNVVRIHDIGEVDGIKFISMPYVQGEDLATILKRGPLPVPHALRLARQIAAGLGAAHEAGVVHRDLKPGNVMIEGDETALIMDFGIARSVRAGTTTGHGTIAGTVVGTIEYMPPEQARGEMVDGRADVYAFGLILYEMLTGPRRFGGDSAVRDLVSRMSAPPPPPRSINPAVPEALDALVTRCLQPGADARFQTSAEVVAALDRLDSSGRPLPDKITKPSWWKLAAAVILLVIAAALVTRQFVRGPAPPPAAREPVSVLIADFENRSGDPVFTGALEDALTLAIEEASFVTSFPRATAASVYGQLKPDQPLNEDGARVVSQREGIKVVLAGVVENASRGYRLTVRAVDPIPGTVITTVTREARTKPEVLAAIAQIGSRLREALGDTTTETAKLAATETFTAASLEAAQAYSRAQDVQRAGKYEEAIAHYRRAIELDPNFGRAYSGWGLAAATLGRTEEAESRFKEALARLDRMSEREKYRTLGVYYSRIARNPEKAMENFQMLVERYPADDVALNNLAIAHFNSIDFAKALEFGGRLVRLYPGRALYQYNFALYAMYASDFARARTHAELALARNADTPKAYLALAMAALAGDRPDEAATIWERAAASGRGGASLAAIGLADAAMYRGRYEDAHAALEPAVANDFEVGNHAGAAQKIVADAEALAALGRGRDAHAAASKALSISRAVEVSVPAARLMLAAGRKADALKIAADLAERLPAQPRAYARVIEAEAALLDDDPVKAVEALREAVKLADLWLVRYTLGIAYIRAGAYAEALSELEACEKRRGEAAAVFLNDVPSWRYMAPLHYWLARAREGVGLKALAVDGYRRYLALREGAPNDGLAADARKRVAG